MDVRPPLSYFGVFHETSLLFWTNMNVFQHIKFFTHAFLLAWESVTVYRQQNTLAASKVWGNQLTQLHCDVCTLLTF